MGIGHFEAVYGRLVTCHSIFGNGIYDLNTALVPVFLIFGESGELVSPVSVSIGTDCLFSDFCPVRKQVDHDTLRTYAVLVVGI